MADRAEKCAEELNGELGCSWKPTQVECAAAIIRSHYPDDRELLAGIEQVEAGIKYANYRWQEWGERAIESFERIVAGAERLRTAIERRG